MLLLYLSFSILLVLPSITPMTTANRRERRGAVNLYDKESLVKALEPHNFASIVYNSTQATLVEFYAHWCGACRKIKPRIVDLARQSERWHNGTIRVAAVNCGDQLNNNLCVVHSITSYPTLKLFGPKCTSKSHSRGMELDSTPVMLERMIDFVQEKLHRINLKDFTSKKLESVFGLNMNAKYSLLVVEDPKSYLGKQLILDFFRDQEYVVIRRATLETNPSLARTLGIDDHSQLPQVYLIKRAKMTPEIFDMSTLAQAVPSLKSQDLGGKKVSGENLDARGKLQWMIDRLVESAKLDDGKDNDDDSDDHSISDDTASQDSTSLEDNEAEFSSSTTPIDLVSDPTTSLDNIIDKVYMQDLESGLSLMLRSDISHNKIISGEKFIALKEWIRILAKYFPGREEVRNYLENLQARLDGLHEITGNDWKSLVDEKNDFAYLPETVEWFHCRGSKPEFRGYPCSLWTIFHVLTVAQVERDDSKSNPSEEYNVKEVIEGIRLFVKHFFTCKECSDNFARETRDYASDLEQSTDAVIYLWKIHNKVNRRLAHEPGQDPDPEFPKVLFPTKSQCPKCHMDTDENDHKVTWNLREVGEYLKSYYSNSNIIAIEESSLASSSSSSQSNERLNDDTSTQAQTTKIMTILDKIFSMRNSALPPLSKQSRFLVQGTMIAVFILTFLNL